MAKKIEVKKIAMLTGGGDAPGLNTVIRAAVRKIKKPAGPAQARLTERQVFVRPGSTASRRAKIPRIATLISYVVHFSWDGPVMQDLPPRILIS